MSSDEPQESELSQTAVRWRDDVAEHDYSAAQAYLSLKLTPTSTEEAVARLRKGKLTTRRANDILRAAGLTACPA